MTENHTPHIQPEFQPDALPRIQLETVSEFEIAYLADTPQVIPILAKWHHEQWGHLTGARTFDQRKARLKYHLQRDAIPTTFVAWVDGQPVASASLIASDMEVLAEWTPWLANVYTMPEFRRRGIGASLVERVASEAAALGYPRLYLYTLDQMHLYESLGWQISHVRHYRGHDMTVMTRDLIVHPPPAATDHTANDTATHAEPALPTSHPST